MNSCILPSVAQSKAMLFSNLIEEKKEEFQIQFNRTRAVSVHTYNRLRALPEKDLQSNNSLESGLPLTIVLSFLETSVHELSNSLYEEMVSISNDLQWLDGITQYLSDRCAKLQSIDVQIKRYVAVQMSE